jgi:hypothetical protein
MRKNVIITTRFSAIHSWPDCTIESVAYLRHNHRHVFHVVIKIPVSHDDRDVEFISKKEEIMQFINKNWEGVNVGTRSCESLAEELLTRFGACYVSVMEDGENGGEVYEN